MSVYRYRLEFSKGNALRFIGHLDLHRTWERTLRRAGVPMAFSEGIHPRMRLGIGQALPLGCTSEGDLMDLWLTRSVNLEETAEKVVKALPPGLTLQAMQPIDLTAPKLQLSILRSQYIVRLPEGINLTALQARVEALTKARSIVRRRRGKTYDLRPLIVSLELALDDGSLHMQLSALDGATGRADEVLDELGIDPADALIHRAGFELERA